MKLPERRTRSFLGELRRRHVFRVAILYALVGFGIIEAADLLFPRLGLPDWSVQLVLGLTIVGFPAALVMAWALELTPHGLRRQNPPGRQTAPSSEPPALADPDPPPASGGPPAAARADATVEEPEETEQTGATADAGARRAGARDPATGRGRDTLLVLPFTNLSPDPENEYFSDGLTDEIIAVLSRIRALGVISRTSAMRLKGTEIDVRALGERLGVRYVMEGSVRKSGRDLRITAQLLEASTDEHLWAETYTGTIDDVFSIQERVAETIARSLRIELSPAEERELRGRRIEDPLAHESYLRARHELWSFTAEGLEKARRHIETAIGIVGDNELLQATLGHIHIWFLQAGIDADPAHLSLADDCARAIFALDPDSRHGHRLRGLIAFQRGEIREARPHMEASFERHPDDPDTLAMLGYLDCLVGREERGLKFFERLLSIDPLTPLNHAMPGFAAVLQGRFADAVEPYRTFREMDDGGSFSTMNWVWVLGLNGRIAETAAVVENMRERHPDSPFTAIARSLSYGLGGDAEAAVEAISPALLDAGRTTEMFARFIAQCYAVAGREDEALDWLATTVRLGMANYPFLAEVDPLLDGIREAPRFAAIMAEVEAEWRAFQP